MLFSQYQVTTSLDVEEFCVKITSEVHNFTPLLTVK